MSGTSACDDFLVDTNGHCFMCLNKMEKPGIPFPLQCLSRCLDFNVKEFLSEKINIREVSKVTLCEGCIYINDQFLEAYAQLEQIKLQVLFLANLIGSRMENGDQNGNIDLQLSDCNWFLNAQKIRIQIIEKCSLKLKNSEPRVRLKRLSDSKVSKWTANKNKNVVENDDLIILKEILSQPRNDASIRRQSTSMDLRSLDRTTTISEEQIMLKKSLLQIRRSTPQHSKFKCSICMKLFANSFTLRRHNRNIHRIKKSVPRKKLKPCNKIYKCVDLCGKVLSNRSNLRRHKKTCPIALREASLEDETNKENQHVEADSASVPQILNVYSMEETNSITNVAMNGGNNVIMDGGNNMTVDEGSNMAINGGGESESFLKCEPIEEEAAPLFAYYANLMTPMGASDNHDTANRIEIGADVTFQEAEETIVPSSPQTLQEEARLDPKVCEVCHKRFSFAASKRRHYRIVHIGEKLFRCSVCDKRFGQKSNLQRHMERYHTGGQVKPPATQTVTVKKEISNDISNVSEPEKKVPIKRNTRFCNICKKLFADRSSASRHFRVVHLNQKPFKCTVCLREFGQKQNLIRHFRLVHGETDMESTENEGNTNKITLSFAKAATVTLQSEGRSCKICKRRFITLQAYQRHYSSNHRKLSFKCDSCNKSFMKKENLQSHKIKEHSSSSMATTKPTPNKRKHRPYSCTVCGNRYTKICNMRRHMKTAHFGNNEKFSCDFPGCLKQFTYKFDLTKHQKKAHVQAPVPYIEETCPLVELKNEEI